MEVKTVEQVRIKVAEEYQKKWLDPSQIKGWLAGVGKIPPQAQEQVAEVIRSLFAEYGLRPDLGHIVVLGDRPYVTREGLLYYARKTGQLKGIKVQIVERRKDFCLVKATVITKDGGEFEAFGDASVDNTNRMVSPHLIRMAETRAINRALREAFPIGLCSFEELSEGDVMKNEVIVHNYYEDLDLEGEILAERKREERKKENKELDKKYITGIHSWSSLAGFDYKQFIKEKFSKESSKELTVEEAKEVIMEAKKKWYEGLLNKGINPINELNKALHKITYQDAKELMNKLEGKSNDK